MFENSDLSLENISNEIGENRIIKNIKFFNQIDSTNEEAKRKANESPDGSLFIAETQTSGKGRLGRQWDSQLGVGLWFSVLLKPQIHISQISKISLLAGLAVCKALRTVTNLDVKIKWPNDIVLNGKKICGILSEMNCSGDNLNYIVIGIGINVNTETFTEELSATASSLKIEGGNTYSRIDILQKILFLFEDYYESYINSNSLTQVLNEYRSLCITLGKDVKINDRDSEIIAKAIDISESGELIVKNENGKLEKLSSSEVSVRGIYGYV